MNEHDLPLELDPTPEEREQLEQLSAWLDDWATDTASRLDSPPHEAPTSTPRPDSTTADIVAARVLTWVRSPRFAAGVLAASVVGFFLLPDPGTAPAGWGPIGTAPEVSEATGNTLQAHDLEVASPHPYMIVPTRDPSISIVWILDTDQGD